MPQRTTRTIALAAVLLTALPAFAQNLREGHWVATWATALVGRPQTAPAPAVQALQPGATQVPAGPAPLPLFNNQTLRQIVRTSVGGDRVRVVLSNAFGTAPLAIGAASIAVREKDAVIATGSGKRLTFSGSASFTMPAGAVALSDPVDLHIPALADLAVDVYLPDDITATPTSPLTMHGGAQQTSYISAAGNHAGAVAVPVAGMTASWFLLARVEVMAPAPVATVVAFGDSITDGARSTANTNNRWPDHLAQRLNAANGAARVAVVNAGIGGNRLLSEGGPQAGMNALARFDRDVLLQTGATHVVIMEGINDIGNARENLLPGAAELIAAQRQLIERARARGLRVYGATLTPFEGANYWTPQGEAKRQALNQWIRTGQAFDGVIDFDAAVRDPNQPTKLLPQYDSGDHLHPSDAGYQAMGSVVDVSLFRGPPAPATR